MRAIDTNDNFGGGKVKFFSGGTGGGQEILLTPLVFGTNECIVNGSGLIPLNGTSYSYASGGSTSCVNDERALSNLPTIDNDYFYWNSRVIIKRIDANVAKFQFDLILDGNVIETHILDVVDDNIYQVTFDPIVEFLNEFPTRSFGILVTQLEGSNTQIFVSANNFFLSQIDPTNDYSEWFASTNFLNGVSYLTAGQTYSSAFGGSTIAIVSSEYPYPIFSQFPLELDIYGLYLSFRDSDITVGYPNEIVLTLINNSGVVENLPIPEGNYEKYSIIYLELSSPYNVAKGQPIGVKVSIDGGSSGGFPIYEIGVYGFNINVD